ncbi:hypothetical protein BDA96_03G093700 [Sorghum bicolor]|uniref:SIAH-type domain-containing protein n=1 Tax=Sorghum bicolor TaxID=4558 RepID=A0A921RB91_SORBI|nr:hypothetical protein BDA96_03G093700 [Sorghum bicolor]
MEKDDGGGGSSSSKSTGDVDEQGESIAERIKPMIFQCPGGHFVCSRCRGDLPDEKCTFGFGSVRCPAAGTLARSFGMERAMESIFIDCRYETEYCRYDQHRLICPHAPCECPEPGCDFAGKTADELLDHLTAGTGHHKWPSTTFRYWVPFDLRIVELGTTPHVLRCSNDGQLFLVSVKPAAEPPGLLAVSLVCVQHFKPDGFQCSVSFSYSKRHRGTSTWELRRPRRFSGSWPPTDYICVVPNKESTDGPDDAGLVLTVNIACIDAVDEEDDLDDSSYDVDSDEDMTMSSS